MILKGKAIKYGDNVNTDVIIPGRYLHLSNLDELASHVMEDLDPDFFNTFNRGDIIVAGKNFGCGSSREQAAICLKYIGVSAIIAISFARIFCSLECSDIIGDIIEGDGFAPEAHSLFTK